MEDECLKMRRREFERVIALAGPHWQSRKLSIVKARNNNGVTLKAMAIYGLQTQLSKPFFVREMAKTYRFQAEYSVPLFSLKFWIST